MKHILDQKVYYSDTDAYGVVWHGSYLRWMEMGRVELCEQLGLNLLKLADLDIAMPVSSMTVKYKSSARLNDNIVVETEIKEVTPIKVIFGQTIKHKETGRLFIQADFAVVAIHNNGNLYRRLPEVLTTAFEKE